MRVFHILVISSVYYGILYAGIALNSNTQRLLRDPYVSITFLYIFVNGLMSCKENDVSSICLKCVYCFKSF